MSYNVFNTYNATFHNAFVPPPPPPPTYFIIPEESSIANGDRNFVREFEKRIPSTVPKKPKINLSISKVLDEIRNLVINLNCMKLIENNLLENAEKLSDEEWSLKMEEIKNKRKIIDETLLKIKQMDLQVLKKLLDKRLAKRARLRRLRVERKREKEDWIKQMQEKSRKIDENLQKVKDEINKVKQEEEAKIQADIVLKETLRKKQDAKKCIVKIEAFAKLRKARENTAKGRGETISDAEAAVFDDNIGKLKSLWIQKLSLYEKEESSLREQLAQETASRAEPSAVESEVASGLQQWREALFGADLPQAEFANVEEFVRIRSDWDSFLDPCGSAVPPGWLPPGGVPPGWLPPSGVPPRRSDPTPAD